MDEVRKHFDSIAGNYERYKKKNAYFHKQVREFHQQIVPPGSRVLEIGCANGDLLSSVKPVYGLGIDISQKMVDNAQNRHPDLEFICSEIRTLSARNDFDYIILSNLLDYIDDLYVFFAKLLGWANDDTKIIITNINPLWAPLIRLGAKLGMRTPDAKRNFITLRDASNILEILGFDISERGFRLILPVYIPLLSSLLNKIIPRLYFINNFSFMQYVVCKKKLAVSKRDTMSCTVVIPCHNEETNIEECIRRIPSFGSFTEIIVVDDGSTDRTFAVATEVAQKDKRVRVLRAQENRGKGNAVKLGFDNARCDVLVILDADMSVMPEDIPKFFNTIADGAAEFVNGTRMVYQMEKEAMKFLNYLGNKIFGMMLSIIMGQRNTDTLCGTKALLKRHYRYMELKDCKWGDFDLLFGAAKLKLKMVEMPVHYKKRISGESKMRPFKHGVIFIKACFKALNKIK